MKKENFFLFCMLSGVLLGCNESGNKIKTHSFHTTEQLETEMNGIYQAILSPVNGSVSGHLNGSLTLVRDQGSFIADVRFANGPANILHTQSIRIGSRCPNENDDLNHDGYIDGFEGAAVYKEIIIPLDDDLHSQRMGLGIYPAADEYGYYFWSRETSFQLMMEDLREEDINLTDDYVKLQSDKSLLMTGKVVVIQGIPESIYLPDTVVSNNRLTPHQAIPIACGLIRKQGAIRGVIDNDETDIPVPGGETIGGSSGGDDGADFSAGTTTGNYGEDNEVERTNNSTEYGNTTGGSGGPVTR